MTGCTQVHPSPPWLQPTLHICPSTNPNSPKSSLPSPVILAHFLDHIPTHSSSTHVYTDGSKSPMGDMALPSSFPLNPSNIVYPPEVSVLATELYAILLALQRISHFPSTTFTIFTDSRNSLSLLQAATCTHPLVHEIRDWLFR